MTARGPRRMHDQSSRRSDGRIYGRKSNAHPNSGLRSTEGSLARGKVTEGRKSEPQHITNLALIMTAVSTSSKVQRVSAERSARAATSKQEAQHDADLVRRFNAGDEDAFVE